MKQNVGGVDRLVRMVLGAILVGYGSLSMMWWLVAVGIVVFLTGVMRFCALYSLFGISTCKIETGSTDSKQS